MNVGAIKRPKPPFNGAVLRWARERRHHSLEEVARKLGTNASNVDAWEEGKKTPTVRQARILAGFYDRPFLEFFYDEPPVIPKSALVPDFRMHWDAPNPRESDELLAIQSWAEEQRLNAIDLFQVLGETPPEFPANLRASLKSAPEEVAASVRTAIDFPLSEQMGIRRSERNNLPKLLRRKLEQVGVLVLKHGGLARHQARGLCIAIFPLPVIVFGREAPSAQAFTLMHEFGHILLGQSAISGPPLPKGAPSPGREIEVWCNQFAAAFLVPADALAARHEKPATPADHIDDTILKALAGAFGISAHAMLIRLVRLGYVKPSFYWDTKRPEFIEQEANYEGGGRAEYYGSRFRSALGDLYTGLVLEAWATGRITNHNAGEFMGIKNLRHLQDIRDRFGT
jgi:Zn-dependent peptidase ImmA (M78 family)